MTTGNLTERSVEELEEMKLWREVGRRLDWAKRDIAQIDAELLKRRITEKAADERGKRAFSEYLDRLRVVAQLIDAVHAIVKFSPDGLDMHEAPALIEAYRAYTEMEERYDPGHRRKTTSKS